MNHMPIAQSARIAAELRERLAEVYHLSEDDEAVSDTVEGECDLPEQIVRLAREALETEAYEKALCELIEKQQARRARLETKAIKLRAIMTWAMEESGFKRLSFPDMSLGLKAGRAPLIVDTATPLSKIPPEFKRVTESADKTAIRASLERGEKLEFARLGNASPVLTIRRA